AAFPRATSAWASTEGSTAPLAIAVDARLDPAARLITGNVRLTVTNRSAVSLTEVRLWLYPNHLATRSEALGDVNFHWLYPRLFSPGHLELGPVRVDGTPATAVQIEDSAAGARTQARVPLPAPLPPGGVVTVEAAFATTIPQRFGSFGCVAGHCRLMGGFYPTPLHLGPGGWQADAAPDRADITLSVRAPAGVDVVAGDRRARGDEKQPVVATQTNAPYATVIAERQGFYQDDVDAGAFRIHYLHRARHAAHGDLVLETARSALAFLQAQRLVATTSSAAERPALWLVEAPLRHELVQVHGELILVSDRIFGIFPLERLRKYHRVALVRAVFTAALDGALRTFENSDDVDLAASALAAYLVDAFTLQEFHAIEYARDLLRPIDFLPAVDQLLYAPLVASATTYFGDVDDTDRLRDDVRRFSHQAPDGRLIYNKLLDLLGRAGIDGVARRTLTQRQPFRATAAAVFGADLDWFWRQWLGPRPRVNYRISSVVTQDRGGGAHVIIDVARQGAAVREPVEVVVTDRNDGVQTLIWNADGPAHRFEVDLPARLSAVEIDPRARLVESAVGDLRPSDDPRYDNRDPQRWRLLYSGFGGLLNITRLSLNFAAIFLLKPTHDLRHALALTAYHSESTQIGVGATFFRFFGRQATRNSLTSAFLAGLSAGRLDPSFGLALGEAPRPGYRLSARIGVEHDDRDYVFDPWRAVGLDATVAYSLTALESGHLYSQATVAVDALRLFELGPGYVLALETDAEATFGDLRLRSQLIGAGGPTGLRGFSADELLGRAQATARIQLRTDFLTDLDWNILYLTSVRGLAGTLFADGAAVSGCDSYAFSRHGLFADAGYSFRVLHDAFGVYQQLLSIDLAIPLNRPARARDCFGMPPDVVRPRFVVLVSFFPNF
ncbi:MAG: hypothetical protein QOI66_5311, partial [Myxococcales bacterium]|nr:hypothetical protein [Myxococcales bacterium]